MCGNPAEAALSSTVAMEPPPIPGLSDVVLHAADLAGIGVAVTVLDPPPPRNVYLSDAAVRILGYPRAELLARPALSNLAPEEQERIAAMLRQRIAGNFAPQRIETVVAQAGGRRVPIASVATQLELGGKPASFSFFWDIFFIS